MSLHFLACDRSARALKRVAAFALLGLLGSLAGTPAARAQFVQRAVGGVYIDAKGMVANLQAAEQDQLRLEREKALQPVAGDLKSKTALRKVSLRRLEEALDKHVKQGTPLPDDMKYLAGLQSIRYVFVYPDQHDIVLAGPGEGWKVGPEGEMVGVTSGRPVLLLDDLLVALRTADAARTTGITCSIDPTEAGVKRLNAFQRQQRVSSPTPQFIAGIEESLGPQTIRVTGVPAGSHFAQVLVAADYRMKRLAMKFDESPIRGVPSFLDLMSPGARSGSMMPRWWLAPAYDPLEVDEEGLAFEIRGASVKAMTEDSFVASTGTVQATGKVNPSAQRWADNMTKHYEELAAKEPIFGELRNCIDLAVVGALIAKERLTEKAGYAMPLLTNAGELPNEQFVAPEHVDSKASVMQKGKSWVITASGGVQINSWQLLEKSHPTDRLAPARAIAGSKGDQWWWN